MDKAQTRITKEIMDNREIYMNMIGDQKERLAVLYDELVPLYNKYYRDLLNESMSRMGYSLALKEHKVDPYLAGGAAQGAAGLGAGIVTALHADARNQKIDSNRAAYKKAVFNDSLATSISERKVLDVVKRIDELLDANETIKQYRDQKMEEEYQKAMEYMKSGSMLAHDIFLSLGDYKDSRSMAEKSIDANNASLVKQVIILSVICSAFVGLFGLAGGLSGYIGVFFCSLLVTSVMFGMMAAKNRIK